MNPIYRQLARPELAQMALTAPQVAPLRIPGWSNEPRDQLYDIQTRGITFLAAQPQAYLGDVTGTGKTIHGIGLVMVLLTNGEARGRRIIFVCLPGNVMQWVEEFARFAPGVRVAHTRGLTRQQRRLIYTEGWDVLVTGYPVMWRDKALLASLQPWLCWFDEGSVSRTRDTQTASGARAVTGQAARVVLADATHVQLGLADLYPQLEVMGLAGFSGSTFGNEWEFDARYVVKHTEAQRIRGGKTVGKEVIDGWRNLPDFMARFQPHYLRRTDGSADMPEVMPPEDIWLELTRPQVDIYRAVALGHRKVANIPMAEQQICASTATFDATLGDHSAKMDWLIQALQAPRLLDADGNPAKVLVFVRNLDTSRLLSRRLDAAGIGYGFYDGPHAKIRDEVRHRFWEDPTMRLVIGTTAMERGANLQIAKYVVLIDLMTNPARITQILGRVKRSGSPHSHVSLLRLLSPSTIEERVLRICYARQELADTLNGDISDIFPMLTAEERRWVTGAAA